MSQSLPEVFYLEREAFLRMLLEKFAKIQGVEVYTHDGQEDPHYLISDLRPKRLFIDAQTYLEQGALWSELDLSGTEIPVVWSGFKDELERLEQAGIKLEHSLQKPLEAAKLLDNLLAIGPRDQEK